MMLYKLLYYILEKSLHGWRGVSPCSDLDTISSYIHPLEHSASHLIPGLTAPIYYKGVPHQTCQDGMGYIHNNNNPKLIVFQG